MTKEMFMWLILPTWQFARLVKEVCALKFLRFTYLNFSIRNLGEGDVHKKKKPYAPLIISSEIDLNVSCLPCLCLETFEVREAGRVQKKFYALWVMYMII